MTWFYNSRDGALLNESPPSLTYFELEAELHTGFDWHAYATEAEVDAAIAANKWPAPDTDAGAFGSVFPTIGAVPAKAASDAASAAQGAASKAASALGLDALFTGGFWMRFAEGVLGLMLVIVAVAELGKGTPIGDAAKKVPFV